MLRILTLLLALLAALPAMAQSRENTAANALFVQAMRDFHAARAMELPPFPSSREAHQAHSDAARRKHAALVAVQQKLGLLIERYPGSDLAVQLITGQPIGGFSAGLLEQEIASAGSLIATPQEIERAEAERVAERRRQAELQRQREGEARRTEERRRQKVEQCSRRQNQPIAIAVVPFAGSRGGASDGRQIRDIIVSNLERSGLFREVALDVYVQTSEQLMSSTKPHFSDWCQINVQALVHGAVWPRGDGTLRVEFRLWDIFGEKQIEGGVYTAQTSALRDIANAVSDSVSNVLAGNSHREQLERALQRYGTN